MAAAHNASAVGAGPRLAATLTRARARTIGSLRERARRVQVNLVLALQAGIAASVAWLIARQVIGHQVPFFAPISAVIVLSASNAQRLRRALELVVGVALGIAIGDALTLAVGTGTWQIGVIVPLAIIVAVFLGSGTVMVAQAASSAVLVATLPPSTGGLNLERFVDALVGGLVGLLVLALILPLNPLAVVRRHARPVLSILADALIRTGIALANRDRQAVAPEARRLRLTEREVTAFRDAVNVGIETATLAPIRWRVRVPLNRYAESAEYLARGLRNARVLSRRAVSVLAENEPLPPALPEAVCRLGQAVRMLRRELERGDPAETTRRQALAAVRCAGEAYEAGVGLYGSVVVAQIRATAGDVIRATGGTDPEVERMVREAFGRVGAIHADQVTRPRPRRVARRIHS